MKTECGIFACIMSKPLPKQIIYNAMLNIQHRGQDSYGYVNITPNAIYKVKEFGLLCDIEQFRYLEQDSQLFLGHMRYSTNTITEHNPSKHNIQPIEICSKYNIYIAHNGNLPNIESNITKLNTKLKSEYHITDDIIYDKSSSDTYIFKSIWDSMYAKRENIYYDDVISYITFIIDNITGAYSCVLSYYSLDYGLLLFGFRDKIGYKPLSICKIDNHTYCFVSETVQLPMHNAEFITDVEPSSIWVLDQNKIKRYSASDNITTWEVGMCALEVIYFMKNESLLFNGKVSVGEFRMLIGKELALQDTLSSENDLSRIDILYIPESSYSIAAGYAQSRNNSTLRNDLIVKIENIRSFIENTNEARNGKLKRKFAFNIEDIKKLSEIILIDDTIVRGNSMTYIVNMLYSINPDLKIHIRIGSPKLVKGCQFGIDLYNDELIACKYDNLAEYFKVASIKFLEMSRLQNLFALYGIMNCNMCFGSTSKYNIKTLEW